MLTLFYSILPNPILIAAAVIPAVVLLVYIYRSDRLDKEPVGLLLSLVFFGIIATSFAKITEKIGMLLLAVFFSEENTLYRALLYFVVVGCSEEGFKYFLLRKRTWYSPDFNCQYDGVVYAVFVSLGFALWENIAYVISYGLGTAMLRAVTAVPGHACFGVFMGAWYGLARKLETRGRFTASGICQRLAFVMPMLIHGCYDFFATSDMEGGTLIFLGFVAVMFLIAFLLVKSASHKDEYIGRY